MPDNSVSIGMKIERPDPGSVRLFVGIVTANGDSRSVDVVVPASEFYAASALALGKHYGEPAIAALRQA